MARFRAWAVGQQQAPTVGVDEDAPVPVFPENRAAVSFFAHRCSTLWRMVGVGMGGALPIGLDYPGVEVVMRVFVPRAERPQLWVDLQVLEGAWLEERHLIAQRGREQEQTSGSGARTA